MAKQKRVKHASKPAPQKPLSATSKKLQNNLLSELKQVETGFTLQNNLSEAVGSIMRNNGQLGEALGMSELPFAGPGFSTQLSQLDTLFKNNRWYLISNQRNLLSQIFVEHGLIQTVVCVPVDDAFRGGVKISSQQLSEDQLEELEVSVDRDGDLRKQAQAAKWNRLYGGAGVLIITGQDWATPFEIDSLSQDDEVEFRAVDMWELFYSLQNVEGEDYDPTMQMHNQEYFDYYGRRVHKSRVMIMKGLEAPSFIRPRLRGWGVSVVEAFVRSINQYLKANDLTFEIIDEFKLDIFKLDGLTTTLTSQAGFNQVKRRVDFTNRQKNYLNAMVLDAKDDYIQKQLSFSGLAEVVAGLRMQIASDLRMPITKLFGTSVSAGMKTDQNDMENYNSMVESEIREKVKYDVLKMLEIKCQVLFGMVPEDLSIEFKPLRVLTAEEEENVKNSQFTRVLGAMTAGLISNFEFREACNRADLLPIKLDTKDDQLNPSDPEISDILEGENMEDDAEEGDGKDAKDGGKSDKTKKKVNSIDYDKAAFAVDGGDSRVGDWKHRIYVHPVNVNKQLWEKAIDASIRAYGKEEWKFIVWWYEKEGGVLR